FDWIHLPVIDSVGLPIQADGRSPVPGLGFIGTPWLVDMGSANLVGVERDAAGLVAAMGLDGGSARHQDEPHLEAAHVHLRRRV
ncbi:MAG TPA: hypothetical protein VEI48_03035, partial [Candidatus Sulfotelmatobacter sp.]|nr:hypothetical protein [Candidatus Sulfotelmatobacter sp.]